MVIGLVSGVWYLLVARNFVSTDNAYVNAQMAQITPLVAGSASELLVRDTQQVMAGDVMFIAAGTPHAFSKVERFVVLSIHTAPAARP